MDDLARRVTATGKRATATGRRMVMDVRREELARLGVDATGLTASGGLLAVAGCGWLVALIVSGVLLALASCGWLFALALVLWKWVRYGRLKLQAALAELPE